MILGGLPSSWSISATDSRAASSCRHSTTRSTPAISSRLAFTSFRSSGAMLTSSICGIVWSRSRIWRPVVPASPSMKTLAMMEGASVPLEESTY